MDYELAMRMTIAIEQLSMVVPEITKLSYQMSELVVLGVELVNELKSGGMFRCSECEKPCTLVLNDNTEEPYWCPFGDTGGGPRAGRWERI